MKNFLITQPVLFILLTIVSAGSLLFLYTGTIRHEWWQGMSFVLLMTSVVLWVGMVLGLASQVNREKSRVWDQTVLTKQEFEQEFHDYENLKAG